MNVKRVWRKVVAVPLAGAMILSLTACGGGSGEAPGAQVTTAGQQAASAAPADGVAGESITLEFQQWWEGELPEGIMRGICDDFTRETGINIELLSNPYADTKVQIASGAAAGTMADVVGLDGSWVYDFAKQGAISNMSELMKADGYDDSQLSDQIQVDGGTYMIPVANFAYPMYVNMNLLEEVGITELPETWSEFKDVCEKVTNKGNNTYGWIINLATDSPSGIQNCFMSWLWASGGNMLKDGQPNLTGNESLTKMVEYIKSLFDAGVVSPGAYAMSEADQVEEFINGRVAFQIDSLAHLGMIREGAPNMNVKFMKVPVMDGYVGESGMDVANWGIGIASNSEYQKEAMAFIEYLMSPEVNSRIAVAAHAFPGNATAEPDYSSSDPLFIEAFELYKECYAINEFTGIPVSQDLMRSMDEQLQLFIDGDTATAEEMLSATQELWIPAFQ